MLDDAGGNDGDGYSNSVQFALHYLGVFNFSQAGAQGWKLVSINCSPANVASADLNMSSVSLNLTSNANVTCIFVNQPNGASQFTPTPTSTKGSTPTAIPSPTPTSFSPNSGQCKVYSPADLPKAIPNGTQSNRSKLTVSDTTVIGDLNVSVGISHTYVGDMKVILTHQESGKSATLIDRPGVPAARFGCKYDDIAAVLSDEASTSLETRCSTTIPTINGSYKANDQLTVFDGISGQGTWLLDLVDADYYSDPGFLNSWKIQLCDSNTATNGASLFDNSLGLVEGRSAFETEDKENSEALTELVFLPAVMR